VTVKVACNPYVRRHLSRPFFQLLVFGMGVSGYWQGTGIFVALEAVFILWVYLTGKPGENGCASARRIALEHVELSPKSQKHAILPLVLICLCRLKYVVYSTAVVCAWLMCASSGLVKVA